MFDKDLYFDEICKRFKWFLQEMMIYANTDGKLRVYRHDFQFLCRFIVRNMNGNGSKRIINIIKSTTIFFSSSKTKKQI